MRDKRGSLWRKWDLHVHTPASLVQKYGGDNDDTWEKFFSALEALPEEFKVLGINDYVFLDGYRRVREARHHGRLKNIDLILPVIELRLDKFGGSKHHLSRVNFHAIFSDELDPAIIQDQFINALRAEYRLDPEHRAEKVTWAGLITRDSLTHLGQKIIDSVPAVEQKHYQEPLTEGFSNLTFHLDSIRKALSSPYFKSKVLTAVGKTEWWNIRWTDGSIADKKDIINDADFVFLSAEHPADCHKARTALQQSGVNFRLLDCSDAHDFPEANHKDRIGQCFTWINADTEFEGLLQALKGPEDRIFLGVEANTRQRVAENRTKYIRKLRIQKSVNAELEEPWFDGTSLDLNPGLVAVIGNKGSGKSALVDIIGLLGNTKRHADASFLNAARFCQTRDNKAKHFQAEMWWENNDQVVKGLSDEVDVNEVEMVTYVPQNLFERICNELAGTRRGQFDKEIKRVIFSHVTQADRLGCSTLDELLDYRTGELGDAIKQRRRQLSDLNREILDLEKKSRPEYRQTLLNSLAHVRAELQAHEQTKPAEVSPPSNEPDIATQRALADLARQRKDVLQRIKETKGQVAVLNQELEKLNIVNQRIVNFRYDYEEFFAETWDDLNPLGVEIENVVKFSVDEEPLKVARQKREEELSTLESRLDPKEPNSLLAVRGRLAKETRRLQGTLDEPNQRYQVYRQALAEWEEKRTSLVGSADEMNTITFYETQLQALADVPSALNRHYEERREFARKIHGLTTRIADLYRQVYRPVQNFIDNHKVARERFQLQFDVSIINASFEDKFFDWINRNKSGSFVGVSESTARLREIISRHDFNQAEESLSFVDTILDQLLHDNRSPDRTPLRIVDQLRVGKAEGSLLDFLFGFEYLEPRYLLKMGGRELHELSPGEKGALLLVFYLLVDRARRQNEPRV